MDAYHMFEREIKAIPQKCSKASSECRQEGNRIYTSNHHDKLSHKIILSHYSKSIALAPNNSEELAVAYGNRSALLLHLKKYEECLIDLKRAYQITNLDDLKAKLSDRKTKCLSLLEKTKIAKKFQDNASINNQNSNSFKKSELPEFKHSKKIPCAAESVSLMYDKKYGRYMVANRDIKPGEVIVAEKGYGAIPLLDRMYIFCTHCLEYALNGVPCDFCSLVIYCSENCKLEAWRQYHDVECYILPIFFVMQKLLNIHDEIIISISLAVRILIQAIKKEGLENLIKDAKILDDGIDMHIDGFLDDGVFQSDKFRSFYNLSNFKRNTEHKGFDIISSAIADTLCRKTNLFGNKLNTQNLIDKSGLLFIKKVLLKLKRTIDVNSCKFEDTNLCDCEIKDDSICCCTHRGLVVALCCSLFNHSCYANTTKIFTKGCKVVLIATVPIKKGEQIYDNYGPTVTQPIEKRKSQLLRNFNFHCDCQACTVNYTLNQDNSLLNKNSLVDLGIFTLDLVKYFDVEVIRFFLSPVLEWPLDKRTLETVIRLIEMVYKHFHSHRAILYGFALTRYLDLVFTKSFGIECNIPDKC